MIRLRELRLKNGLSQRDVGEMFGITKQAVQRWETGKSYPNVYQLIKLSNYFDVSIDYLVGRTGDE